ncbi:MAG: twin transmembrane helix small protein [Oleiphilaceae bacterium]|nr:twin transmembrane helix small protein [Oleiphilaceae bacterium]
MLKVVIVILMLAVLVSLFTGLFFLIKDEGKSTRVVNSLAVRVGLSLLLLTLIIVSAWQGELAFNPTP